MGISTLNIKINNHFLFGYEEGYKIKQSVLKKLASMPDQSILAIDFANVQFIDVTCAEELIVKSLMIAREKHSGERFLILKHLSKQHEENIDTALKIAKQAILAEVDGMWRALGNIPENLCGPLNFVIQNGKVTAEELATYLDLPSVSLATKKLNALYQFKLLDRQRAQSDPDLEFQFYEYYSLV
jgi:hypothetical protein